MDASPIAGRYEVIRPLGQGSFAETLLARDLTGGQLVAIKVLHPRAPQTKQRLRRVAHSTWEHMASTETRTSSP